MNNDDPNIAGDEPAPTSASVEFNKRKTKPRGRKGGKKVVKKTKKIKKAGGTRRGHAYEIVTGRPAAAYPTPHKGTVPAAIWAALKSKKRATAQALTDAIRGKIKSKSAKDPRKLVGHVGWYLTKWKKLKLVRFAKA
jgi:hypothetical protein